MATDMARTPPAEPDAAVAPAPAVPRWPYRNVARTLGVAASLAFLFTIVLAVSIAGVTRGARPSAALFWQPADAEARVNQAALILSMDRSADALARARALALDGLRRDATNPAAYRTLGAVAEAGGDRPEALRFYREAQRMSRRDQATQLWFIGQYYQRNDPAGMIRHFDIALRTTRRGRDTLLPLLVNFSGDRRIVPPLRRLLAAKPAWWRDFASLLVQSGPRAETAVELTRGLLDPNTPDDRPIIERLLGRLAGDGEYALAWSVYAGVAGPANGSALLRDGGFEGRGGFAPFDWELAEDADLTAYREPRADGAGSALRLQARGRSGAVASQLLHLPPGRYLFRAEVGDVPRDSYDRPRFRMVCAQTPATALLDHQPARPSRQPLTTQAQFVVPSGCAWQSLSVQIAGADAEPEFIPWVDNLSISRR